MRDRVDRTGQTFRSVSVDLDSYLKLAEIARNEERSISWVIKRMVRGYEPAKV